MAHVDRQLRMGMVGGGQGALIGGVHRLAARMDDEIELVAGCFSRDPANSATTGAELRLDPDRIYSHEAGNPVPISDYPVPTVLDGVRGMQFVATAVESASKGSIWVTLP
jgi:hypothetical protein